LTILPQSFLSVYKVRNFCEALPGFEGLEEGRSPSLGPKTQEELHKSSFICFPQTLLGFEGQAEGRSLRLGPKRKSLTKVPSKALLGFEGPAKGRSPSLGPKTQEEPEEEPHKRSFKASPRGSSCV
jgi:hypothetical protein